jgi:hypothetical protein
MMRSVARKAGVLCVSAALSSASALAQTPNDYWQLSDSWRFGATVYGYLPDVGVKATLPNGESTNVTVGIDKILDHLKMAFFGAFEAQKGRWGAFTDVIYMDVGAAPSKTRNFSLGEGPLSADVAARTTMDLKATIWTLGGSYRVVADPQAVLDVLAGARLLDVKIKQGWELTGNIGPIPLPGRSGGGDVSASDWDAIIGIKGRLALSADRRWFVPYYVDVGTGESKLTYQALGGIGYAFSWGDVTATWRYLAFENSSGKPLQKLDTNGPMIAVGLHW